ncbi:MAG: metal ABC transporter permease [Nitrospirae bacterium]|nr:MAG: metal ABC transporter permease [Nitrospirota bacterium]
MEFIEFLNYGFVQRAVIAGSFIAVLCSILGMFLVLRRLSLIGDGLAHVTFGGVALGLLFKVYPIYASIPVVLLGGYGILKLMERARLYGDAAIGIVSAAGIALGVLIASIAGGFNVDLFSYLFGNILAVSKEEVVLSAVMSLTVLVIIGLFYHELISVTFDEDLAKVSGIKTKAVNMLLVMLTAVTVVLAMRLVGVMLVSALLILPAVSAFQAARSFRSALMLSSAFGVLSVLAGIFISFSWNLPAGATIVLLNILILAVVFLFKKLRG